QREAQVLLVVGDAGDAVLAPAIGPRSRLVVCKEIPRVSVLAVILAHRAPLPLAQIGTPFLPGDFLLARVVQPFLLIHNHSVHAPPSLCSHRTTMQSSNDPHITEPRTPRPNLDCVESNLGAKRFDIGP